MKKLIIISSLIIFSNCFSQTTDNSKDLEIIKIKTAKYLLEKDELDNIENINSKISIIEILDNKILGYNEIGIYRIYSHTTSSYTHILLKNKNKISFIDLKNFSKSFKKIIKFLEINFSEDSKKIEYLDKILEVYHNNNYDEKIRL